MMKRILILQILFLLIVSNRILAQEPSDQVIDINCGLGIHTGSSTNGVGLVYTIGFQKETKNNRLKLKSAFRIGQYSSKVLPLDARDQYFNSVNIETGLHYDLIKTTTFALFVESGIFINNTIGLQGTRGDPELYSDRPESEYITQYHYGASLSGGIKLSTINPKVAVNIIPLNILVGTNNFLEFNSQIGIEIKL